MDDIKETIENINIKAEEIRTAIGGKADSETVESLKNEMSDLKEIARTQGEFVATLKKDNEDSTPVTFASAIKNALISAKDRVIAVKNGKASGTGEMTLKEVTSASVQDSTASYYINGIGHQPVRRFFLNDTFAQGTVGSESGGTITYWDEDSVERQAQDVEECQPFPESTINWKEYSVQFTKVADSIPICAEAMEDYAFIESEVKNYLLVNVLLQNDQNILNTIDTTAQLWQAGAFAGTLTTPSTFDVIKIGKSQVEVSGQNNSYSPNIVLMNPEDYTALMLTKDANGQYIFPMYMTSAELVIDGMNIITSTLVPQDILYIFDSTKGTVYNMRGLSLDYASEHGEDFLHDRIRLRATLRKAFVIRNVNANAFLKVDSIAGAIGQL